ncbi:agmatinase family protein [Primorskyibacter sp. S87]|uniref:agmatinase family protein n=1 Tax=Primorskyibacter sp. S87 TaxID=3415126 RepID=UPI003C7D2A17
MGVPMDNGGYGRVGTSWAAQAVRTAEVILPWGPSGVSTETQVDPFADLVMVDYGDIPVDAMSIERSLGSIRETVREVAETGAIPIMVGGNHSIMYPHVLGVTDDYGKKSMTIIHVDAHTDMSSENLGHYVTIGNMVKLSVEEGLVDGKHMISVGQRAPGYGPDKLAWYRENNVRIYWQGEFEDRGFRNVLMDVVEDIKAGPGKIYLSVDIDVLDPAAAPGVTAPVLGGWTTRQLVEFIRTVAVTGDIVGADFVEYNPLVDDRGRTTALITNNMIRELLNGIALRKNGIREPHYYHPDILGGNRN